jgi:hypothetical protein
MIAESHVMSKLPGLVEIQLFSSVCLSLHQLSLLLQNSKEKLNFT